MNNKRKLTKSSLYDMVYDLADYRIDQRNPCQWGKTRCIRDREENTIGRCCEDCEYLTGLGCSIKSIGCKLSLCSSIQDQWIVGYLAACRDITSRLGLYPYCYRHPKPYHINCKQEDL
jgi:hypothetical protein